MTHSAVDLSPTDTFELSAASVRVLLVSRESAVRRIFTGGALTLLAGPTLFLAGFLVDTNLQPLGIFAMLASIALAGTGETHARQIETRRPNHFQFTTGGDIQSIGQLRHE